MAAGVVAGSSRPSTVPGTTRVPCSITRPCTGRTNCASPAPQRMTFGIGQRFQRGFDHRRRGSSSSVLPGRVHVRDIRSRPSASVAASSCLDRDAALLREACDSAWRRRGPCIRRAAVTGPFARSLGPALRRARRRSSTAEPARRGEDASSRCRRLKREFLAEPSSAPSAERVGQQLDQRLRRQLLGEQFDQQRGFHARRRLLLHHRESRAARATRSRPAPPRARGCARGRCRRRAR